MIASGLGSSRHRAYTVIGNSVNLAARLLELAGAGEGVGAFTVDLDRRYLQDYWRLRRLSGRLRLRQPSSVRECGLELVVSGFAVCQDVCRRLGLR